MERLVERKIDAPQLEATIIDGAVSVQILKPGMATTFKEYAESSWRPFREWTLCGMYIVKTV